MSGVVLDPEEENRLKKTLSKAVGLGETERSEGEESVVRPLLRPPDQERLTEEELQEPITRVLTTINPLIPPGQAEYSFLLAEYVLLPSPTPREEGCFLLSTLSGTAIKKDGREAKAQLAAGFGNLNLDDSGSKKPKAKADDEEDEEEEEEEPAAEEDKTEETEEDEGAAEDDDVQESAPGEVSASGGSEDDAKRDTEDDEEEFDIQPKAKKLENQFNFCERAALTVNLPSRSVETQTYPPPRATFSATAIQSIIYDFYQQDYALREREREDEKPKKVETNVVQPKKKIPVLREKSDKELHEERVQLRARQAWTILERLVNQNIFDEIGHDYRYWEDPSDEFREGEGSLLPLWRFSYDRMRTSSVTALSWNPHYYDLFAVAFGSLEFIHKEKEGCLCLFTVKNPSFPEYFVSTDSPVICLDIHNKFPYLIVVGLYDGNVCVYNAQLANEKGYQYKSNSVEAKHSALVWEVRWAPDSADGECSFWSVSEDGRVMAWSVTPSELLASTAIHLALPAPAPGLPPIRGCGTCLTFHPTRAEVYLVGTEEGQVLRCSRAYSRAFLSVQCAHHMPVHALQYNPYDPTIYATCSADWRVKIWEDGRSEPLFWFDLGSSVGDVKWAPYSSTVFAACTSDGKVFVFDLNVNKYKPICIQSIVSKKVKKLTRIDFNYHLPILLCGDTKGAVHLVKLSPSLRVMCKPPKKQQGLSQRTLQEMKLAKLLSLVREPPATLQLVDEKVEED